MAEGSKGRGRRARPDEFRFKIEAYTPDTMPMARLAEYLSELATILGEEGSVHLLRIEPGSTALVHRIEREAIPKVQARAKSVVRGEGPAEAQRAYRNVNRYLREDNAKAVFRKGIRGRRIIEFPGAEDAEDEFPSVSQAGSLSGEVLRVGGSQDRVPVLMESEGELIAGCHANRQVAKALARHLFESVILHGIGHWMRDDEGLWNLRHFRIDSFEPQEAGSLSEALTKLRSISGDLGDAAYSDVKALRRGSLNGAMDEKRRET